MFATMGAIMEGVSVKTDSIETAQMLIEAGVGTRAPYFHRSWIHLDWNMDEAELGGRLANSYRLIVATLPKKVQTGLAPLD
jgi:predicted DNA-binding protein (MmcQ/YjbR family)